MAVWHTALIRAKEHEGSVGESFPVISVVVPTHDRAPQLARCLEALAVQEYPRDRYKVIVADDGSPDPADGLVRQFAGKMNVVLVTQKHVGPAATRNLGASHAPGEFLAFTDDDCVPARDWLARIAARLARHPGCMVGGQTINALTENLYSSSSQALVDILYDYYNVNGGATFLTTSNVAMSAAQFRATHGFDPAFRFAEDREFCDRWLHHGYGMVYAPEMRVHHYHNLTLARLWRQHFHYGRGARHFHVVRAERGWGNLRPEAGFYRTVFHYPLARVGGTRGLRMEALMLWIQMANAAGFFFQALKGTPPATHSCRP